MAYIEISTSGLTPERIESLKLGYRLYQYDTWLVGDVGSIYMKSLHSKIGNNVVHTLTVRQYNARMLAIFNARKEDKQS